MLLLQEPLLTTADLRDRWGLGSPAKEICSALDPAFTERKRENAQNSRKIGSKKEITLEGKLKERRNKNGGWRESYFLHFINVHRPDGARAFFIFLLKFVLLKSLFVPLFLVGCFSTFLTHFYSSVLKSISLLGLVKAC